MIRTTFIQKIYIALAFCTLLFGGFFVAPAEANACEIELSNTRFRTNAGLGGAQPADWFNEENPPYVYIDIDTINCSNTDSLTLTIFGLQGLSLFGSSDPGDVIISENIEEYPIGLGSADENGRLTVALQAGEELCYVGNNLDCLILASIQNQTNTNILALLGNLLGNLSFEDATYFAQIFGSQAIADAGTSDATGSNCGVTGTALSYYFQELLGLCDIGFYFNGYGSDFDEKLFQYYNNYPNLEYEFTDVGVIPNEWRVAFPGLMFNCEGTGCSDSIKWKIVPNGILEYGATHSDDAVLVNPFSDSYQEVYTPLAPLPFEGLNGGDTGDLGQYLAAIFRTAIVVLVILAVLMLVFYGFAHATVDSITKKDTYREKTWNILYALLLALGAWLLLNTISPNLASNLKLTIPNVTLAGDAESVSTQPITTDAGTITGFQLPGNMNIFCEGSGGSAAVPSIIDSFENKVTYRYGGKGGALGNGQNFVQSPGEGNSGNYMCNNNGQQVPCRSFCPDQSICLDCSGFVNHVRQCAGLSIYAGTTSMTTNPGAIPINTSQITNNGQEILINGQSYTFQPGDLLVWKGHVVIYYGNGYIAESKGDLASFKNPNTNIKKSLLAQSSYLSKITHLIKANP